MTDIGTITMRKPNGGSSFITVSRREGGEVDIHASRTSQGETLIRLPASIASQLAELLRKASGRP